MNLGRWFNKTFYCPFWGCEPPEDGTWWRAQNDMIVITPEARLSCKRCGRKIDVNAG